MHQYGAPAKSGIHG